jgi:glycine/D-amino acid oxidase-like deaminating enzyme
VSTSDVSVIGGGVIGLAVAATLRDRGVDVACFERGEPGEGQSAGRTRQFRHLHADPKLIALAVQAREGWLEWEERFGRMLLGNEGALRVGATQHELEALRAVGVPAVEVDSGQAQELFEIAELPAGRLLFDPQAGAIRAHATTAALTEHIGGALRQTHVSGVRVGGDAVELDTADGVHSSARCVVCAGAGTDRLVRPLGLAVGQDRQAHLRLTFRVRSASVRPMPCFSDRTELEGEVIYALSDLDDRYAVGLADVFTYPAVEDLALDIPDGAEVSSHRERIVAYVRRVLVGLDPEPIGEVFRLTTTLPDCPDDGYRVWSEGPVVAVAGPNLFKFAPVIGEQLAAAVTGGSAAVSTAPGTPVAPSR